MILPQLLDAVKDRVAAVDLGLAPEEAEPVIRRRYLPDDAMKALAALHVDVSPGTAEYDLANRSENEAEFVIQIGFRQSLPKGVDAADEQGNAWLDSRLELVSEVIADLTGDDHDDDDAVMGVALNTINNDPMYDVDTLRKHNVFLSIVNLTYSRIQ